MSTMELAAGGLLRPAPGLALSGLHSSWTQRSAGIVAWHQPSVPCCRSCSPPCCSAGDVVFQLGAPADEMYIVERGQGEGWPTVGAPGSPCLVLHRAVAARLPTCSFLKSTPFITSQPAAAAAIPSMPPTVVCRIDFNAATVHSRSQLPAVPADARPVAAERAFKYGPGGLFGELDFFLQRPRRSVVDWQTGLAWLVCSAVEARNVLDHSMRKRQSSNQPWG